MIYSRWNSPEALRCRAINKIKAEANSFGYTMPNDKIDIDYPQGQLLEHAELLLKDAVTDSIARDLHEVTMVNGNLKAGSSDAYNATANQKDFGMGTSNEYKLPTGWNLPIQLEIWDQHDRLTKAAALIMMEIERLDRMRNNGIAFGYGMFNPEYRAEKKEADAALVKQQRAQREQQQLDIYQQIANNNPSFTINYAGSNVTASTQPQFTGTIQPMPQAVPCPVC